MECINIEELLGEDKVLYNCRLRLIEIVGVVCDMGWRLYRGIVSVNWCCLLLFMFIIIDLKLCILENM